MISFVNFGNIQENTYGFVIFFRNALLETSFLWKGTISASFHSLWNFEERIKALIPLQMYLTRKASIFKNICPHNNFLRSLLGSSFSINFLNSSALVSIILKVLDLFFIFNQLNASVVLILGLTVFQKVLFSVKTLV